MQSLTTKMQSLMMKLESLTMCLTVIKRKMDGARLLPRHVYHMYATVSRYLHLLICSSPLAVMRMHMTQLIGTLQLISALQLISTLQLIGTLQLVSIPQLLSIPQLVSVPQLVSALQLASALQLVSVPQSISTLQLVCVPQVIQLSPVTHDSHLVDAPCHLHQRYKPLNLIMHFLPLLQVILSLVVQLLIGGRNPNEVTSK